MLSHPIDSGAPTRMSTDQSRPVVQSLADLLTLALAETDARWRMWVDVKREIAIIEARGVDGSTHAEHEAFLDGMYQALSVIEEGVSVP
jgi:hypothetical protein